MAELSSIFAERDHFQFTQELVYYAASRFRLAILSMTNEPIGLDEWHMSMQSCLRDELVCIDIIILLVFILIIGTKHFILIIIGHATATGLPMDIPVLIRSLAEKIFSPNIDFLSYILSSNISKVLYIGCPERRYSGIEKMHSLNWWDHRTVRPMLQVLITYFLHFTDPSIQMYTGFH